MALSCAEILVIPIFAKKIILLQLLTKIMLFLGKQSVSEKVFSLRHGVTGNRSTNVPDLNVQKRRGFLVGRPFSIN